MIKKVILPIVTVMATLWLIGFILNLEPQIQFVLLLVGVMIFCKIQIIKKW